ncbi:MAG: xanthine dehydrogenase family protein subunit M [Desulfatiglandales bacterium]
MSNVGYFAPTEVGEALKLLAEYGEKANILAGGTDLVPKINYYELRPDNLIFIGGLGLDYIKEEDQKLVIGAGTTWTQIATSTSVLEKAGILAEAAQLGASVAIRNAGTIGGNLANASPAADLAAALLALDAELSLKSEKGDRVVAIKDFFTGPGETVRKPSELLTEISIPVPKGKTSFLKLGRRKALTLSVANTGVHLIMDGNRCEDARISLGAMAPTPLRCTRAEELIKGKAVDATLISECAAEAVNESSPIDDQRATAWYRKKAGKALVARALAKAAGINN